MKRSRAVAPRASTLELYDDPALYDATYQRRLSDVRFYVERARRSGGPVLEYGVGTGRVAFAMARAGIEVVGVDPSPAMLERLEAKRKRLPKLVAQRVETRRGDMRQLRLARRFALIVAPFNVVLHLDSTRDMERWLARVREHLAPEGELLFDVSVPQALDLGADPTEWHEAPRFRHPVTGRPTAYAERFQYDSFRQVLLIESRLWPEGAARPRRVPLVHRQWFPRELEAILHYNGFTAIRLTADFSDLPPTGDVDSLIVTCHKAERRR